MIYMITGVPSSSRTAIPIKIGRNSLNQLVSVLSYSKYVFIVILLYISLSFSFGFWGLL